MLGTNAYPCSSHGHLGSQAEGLPRISVPLEGLPRAEAVAPGHPLTRSPRPPLHHSPLLLLLGPAGAGTIVSVYIHEAPKPLTVQFSRDELKGSCGGGGGSASIVRHRFNPSGELTLLGGACFLLPRSAGFFSSWARRRFEEIEGRWERSCFHAWAEWTANLAAERQRKLERAGRTLRNIAAYRSFRSWKVCGHIERYTQAHATGTWWWSRPKACVLLSGE